MPKQPDFTTDLTDHFLIAMPGIEDDLFGGSLVYVCEHNDKGALGLIVNKTTDITVQGLFERMDMQLPRPELAQLPVLMGGPLHQDRGFVLHDTEPALSSSRSHKDFAYASSLSIPGGLAMTSSRDVMDDMSMGAGPRHALLALGCSSWDEGQLESELIANAWLTVKADPELLFHLPPAKRYARAFELLGIEPRSLAPFIGHA